MLHEESPPTTPIEVALWNLSDKEPAKYTTAPLRGVGQGRHRCSRDSSDSFCWRVSGEHSNHGYLCLWSIAAWFLCVAIVYGVVVVLV